MDGFGVNQACPASDDLRHLIRLTGLPFSQEDL